MRRAAPGFSLLEVMVALAISAMVIATVAVSFGAVNRAYSRARENLDLNQTMNESLARMRVLLQSSYLSPYPANQATQIFDTMDLENMNSPYDAITFTTTANTTYKINAKEAELAEVTLFTAEEPAMETAEGRLELKRLRVRVGGSINSRFEVEGGVVYTLADHVTEFALEYLAPEGDWKKEWKILDHNFKLPCAVRITLGLRSENLEEQKSSIIVPLKMSTQKCRFEDERVFEQWQNP